MNETDCGKREESREILQNKNCNGQKKIKQWGRDRSGDREKKKNNHKKFNMRERERERESYQNGLPIEIYIGK